MMEKRERQLSSLIDKLRWVIPALIAALGFGYTLFEHLLVSPDPIASVHIIREAIVIGTVGPAMAWLLLTWATRIAQSRQQAEETLKRRALQLETASLVGRQMTKILDIDRLLRQVVDLIRKSFGYYHVHI